MQQILLIRPTSIADNAGQSAMGLVSGDGYQAIVNQVHMNQLLAAGGTLSNLVVDLSVAPGAGKSWTVTVMKNDGATSLSVVVSGTDTSGEDATNTVNVVAGDRVCLRLTPTGTPATMIVRGYTMFTGTDSTHSLVLDGNMETFNALGTKYNAISTAHSWNVYPENKCQCVMPIPGTISNEYVRAHLTIGHTTQYDFAIRKNSLSSICNVILNSATQQGSDASSDTVVAGDNIGFRGIEQYYHRPKTLKWGFRFVPATAGLWVYMTAHTGSFTMTAARYGNLHGNLVLQSTETTAYQYMANQSLSDLRVKVLVAPGAGKSWTFTVRKNGADTSLTCTISGTDTEGYDTLHLVEFAKGDYATIGIVPAGTPADPEMMAWSIASSYGFRGSIYPTEAITRITNIIHRYNRARQTYSMELSLGEVTTDFGLPEWLARPQVAIPESGDEPVTEKRLRSYAPDPGDRPPPPEPPPSPKPEFPPFVTRPALPGIITGIEEVEEGLPKVPSKPQYPPTEKLMSKAWRALTPWEEEKGETFGSALGELWKSLTTPKKRKTWPWSK